MSALSRENLVYFTNWLEETAPIVSEENKWYFSGKNPTIQNAIKDKSNAIWTVVRSKKSTYVLYGYTNQVQEKDKILGYSVTTLVPENLSKGKSFCFYKVKFMCEYCHGFGMLKDWEGGALSKCIHCEGRRFYEYSWPGKELAEMFLDGLDGIGFEDDDGPEEVPWANETKYLDGDFFDR